MTGFVGRLLLAATLLLAACGASQQAGYLPVPDGGLTLIVKSRSTNTRAVSVVIYPDGSGVRSIAEDGGFWTGNPNGADSGYPTVLPANFPPHTPELDAFLSDLARIDDVSEIPIEPRCIKSVSFGTTTVVSANQHTSGDLECADSPSSDEQALIDDCLGLTNLQR